MKTFRYTPFYILILLSIGLLSGGCGGSSQLNTESELAIGVFNFDKKTPWDKGCEVVITAFQNEIDLDEETTKYKMDKNGKLKIKLPKGKYRISFPCFKFKPEIDIQGYCWFSEINTVPIDNPNENTVNHVDLKLDSDKNVIFFNYSSTFIYLYDL